MTRWTARHSSRLQRSGILGLNFHEIASDSRDEVSRTLRRASRLAPSLDLEEPGPDGRPAELRLFVAFYDGFRDTSLYGADICQSLGIRAWFFPIFSPDEPGSATLTDTDLRDISQVHEIGFHTSSHLSAREITDANLEQEVDAPMRRIERIAGHPPRLAAWCGGSRFAEEHLGDRALRRWGVRSLVSNWSIERVPPAATQLAEPAARLSATP